MFTEYTECVVPFRRLSVILKLYFAKKDYTVQVGGEEGEGEELTLDMRISWLFTYLRAL